jgi:hypothetical protein
MIDEILMEIEDLRNSQKPANSGSQNQTELNQAENSF